MESSLQKEEADFSLLSEKYQILEILGQGAYGKVAKAQDI